MQVFGQHQTEQNQKTQQASGLQTHSDAQDGLTHIQSPVTAQRQALANRASQTTQLQVRSQVMAASQRAVQLKAQSALIQRKPQPSLQLRAVTPEASHQPEQTAQTALPHQLHPITGKFHTGMGAHPIQLATITGSGGTVKTFNETATKSVSYAIGDKVEKAGGTATGTAEWKDVLIDAGTNNSATQLHLVNMDWGGKGGATDGNIFPGSQSLNGHHKKQENKFRGLFSGVGKTAPAPMTYTCSTNGPVPDYTFPLGPAAADVALKDHTVHVKVTNDTTGLALIDEDVDAGKDMKIRDPQ